MSWKDCVAAITAAAGRTLSDAEVERIVDAVQSRIERRLAVGDTMAAAATAAGREVAGDALLAAFIERRNAALNVAARQRLDARIVPGREAESIRAVLSGTTRNIPGAAQSIDALLHAHRDRMLGGLLLDLERAGLLRAVAKSDASFDRDVAIELFRHDDPGAVRGTNNRHAEIVAGIFHKWREALRLRLNEAGAWIGKLDNYITRQSHDADKVRGDGSAAAFQAWRDFIRPKLDPMTFVGREDPEQFLRNVWNNLSTARHDASTDATLAAMQGPGNLARRLSEERVLHFKDPVSWWEYNRQFGRGAVLDSIVHGIEKGARDLALMETLGPNPEAMFKGWIDRMVTQARDAGDVNLARSIDSQWNARILDQLTGAADRPGNHTLATVMGGWRILQAMARLGGVVLSSLPDLAVNAAMLRHNGIPLFHSYFEQMRGLLPRSMPEREASLSLGVGIDHMVANVAQRLQAEGVTGRMGDAARVFYRLTGLTWWTEALKRSAGLMLSHNLATHSGTAFDALPGRMQATLRRYGIEAGEWNGVAAHVQSAGEAGRYVIPAEMTDRALADKLQAYITDQVREGMTEVSAASRAAATLGTQRGTPAGELVRTLAQFKQYTVTFAMRTLAREFRRDGLDVGGIAHLVAGTFALGYLSMTLKELAKGREPREWSRDSYQKIVLAALAQGGGLGIYGDFLFGEANRLGGGFVGSLAGPTAGTIEDMHRVYTAMRDQSGHPIADGIQAVKNNAPFVNLFYTRAALDYLVIYRLQEWANPGYLARMEARVRRENNQQFWLRPTGATR